MLSSPLVFFAALLLLWFPRRWMRAGTPLWRRRQSRRSQEPWAQREPGDPRLRFWDEIAKMRNWFDLMRGAAGSLAIFGGHGIEQSVGAADEGPGGLVVLSVQAGIVFIGLVIQVARRERGRGTLFAPIFYLAGVSVGLCGGWAALFGFVLAWALNPMFASAAAFVVVEGLAMAGFGLMLRGMGDLRPPLACLFCLVPALISLLSRRPLVVFSRRAPPEGAGGS